ncbi:hypothetical protein [Streptomyces sp. NPDC088812]|uniref:hypothetical protein n=1 Tax=Streptomyces sp. NPDC088812 TaxID=3365905 RepID=UPI0037F72C0B
MSTERIRPKYRKDRNGYVFSHQYTDADGKSVRRSVRISRITPTRWQSFDYYSDKQIEGTITTGRDTSAFAAMDAIDRETANEQQATAGEGSGTSDTALAAPDVTGPPPLASSSQAAPAVVADVEVRPVPAPQANVLPHLRPTDQGAQDEAWRRSDAVEGVVVGRFANGTKGSLPKDSEHEDVKAALQVLAGTEKHHMRLKVALLRDEYDADDPSTFDVDEARGAWVVPGEMPGMVKIYILLAGQYIRYAHRYPHATKSAAQVQEDTWTVEKKIYADRFREVGWHVEDGHKTGLGVIVWKPGTRPALPAAHAAQATAGSDGEAADTELPEPPTPPAQTRPGASLKEHAYSGHMMLFEAAVRLEDFRRHRDRQHLAPAAHLTRHAAATFKARVGDGSELTWDLVTRYLVEIRSRFYAVDRDISFDPNPPAGDMFARDPATSLPDLCPEGHMAVMNAARHLDFAARRDDGSAADWADRQAWLAADHFRDTLANGNRATWVMICRYAAELHAATLRARREHRTGASS